MNEFLISLDAGSELCAKECVKFLNEVKLNFYNEYDIVVVYKPKNNNYSIVIESNHDRTSIPHVLRNLSAVSLGFETGFKRGCYESAKSHN